MRENLRFLLGLLFIGVVLAWLAIPSGRPAAAPSDDTSLGSLPSVAVPGSTTPATAGPVTAAPTTTSTTQPPTTTTPPDPAGQQPGRWAQVFYDEFEGDTLAVDRWVTCYWWDDQGCSNEGNEELEWYQPGNVIVDDGVLALEAREEQIRTRSGDRYPYTSGMITTGRDVDDLDLAPGFVFTHGYVEVRAKVPSGKGLWPAIWLLAADHESRPEIDIIEVLGDTPETARFHIHYVDRSGDRLSQGQDWIGPDLSEDWHLYGVEWTEDRVTWYIDGVARWEVTDPEAVPHEDLYLIINLAVGGEWPGAPDDDTEFPARFLVDYVRIWQSGSGR